jgi:hypothetical protein
MNSSNSGTVNELSPCAGLQIMPLLINAAPQAMKAYVEQHP